MGHESFSLQSTHWINVKHVIWHCQKLCCSKQIYDDTLIQSCSTVCTIQISWFKHNIPWSAYVSALIGSKLTELSTSLQWKQIISPLSFVDPPCSSLASAFLNLHSVFLVGLTVRLPGDWANRPIYDSCTWHHCLTSFRWHGGNFIWSFVFLHASVLSPTVQMVVLYNRSDTWHFTKLLHKKLWLFLNRWSIWSGASHFNKSIIMPVV